MNILEMEFSYDPEYGAIVHLPTNRRIIVTSESAAFGTPVFRTKRYKAFSGGNAITFLANREFGFSFIRNAMEWYCDFKGMRDVRIVTA